MCNFCTNLVCVCNESLLLSNWKLHVGVYFSLTMILFQISHNYVTLKRAHNFPKIIHSLKTLLQVAPVSLLPQTFVCRSIVSDCK
jgi:membrane protein CcdC involved in cytochrome C biogenesis